MKEIANQIYLILMDLASTSGYSNERLDERLAELKRMIELKRTVDDLDVLSKSERAFLKNARFAYSYGGKNVLPELKGGTGGKSE